MVQRRRRYSPGLAIPGTPYAVTCFIGCGAMGAVYEVEHRELQKTFVMKILHDDLVNVEDSVRRIKCECRFLARIEHPNIVKVTDAGLTTHGVPFFVMERLEGETLASRLRRRSKWPVREVAELSIGILDGLFAAHSLGIVHRDIKPSNIFLAESSGVKLIDFGIAKSMSIDASATASGITLGTPRYMAPEQVMGGLADCRSDLYALGIIMYELLAGQHPFSHATTPAEMLIAQASWQVPPLTVERGSATGIDDIVARLLSKDPGQRPSSANTVRAAILAGSTVITSRFPNWGCNINDGYRIENVLAAPVVHEPMHLAYTRHERSVPESTRFHSKNSWPVTRTMRLGMLAALLIVIAVSIRIVIPDSKARAAVAGSDRVTTPLKPTELLPVAAPRSSSGLERNDPGETTNDPVQAAKSARNLTGEAFPNSASSNVGCRAREPRNATRLKAIPADRPDEFEELTRR